MTYDVAIIGYGPVGAVAAALLGQAGLSVYVCDRLPDVHDIPRALSLDHEVLRVFQQLGISDAVAPYIEAFTASEWLGAEGQLIRRMTMVDPPYPQGYTPSNVFTQPPVERALRQAVAALPQVTVALSTVMKTITADGDGVTLQVQTIGQPEKSIHARWAIACDGGGSSVRSQMGLALEDLGFDEPWLVVDLLVNEQGLAKLPGTSVQYCEPSRPCTMVIGPGNHRRWEISLNAGDDPKQAATPAGTWQLLSRWLTPDDAQLWRQASYRFHALVAQRWRAGRVFVAGDAAHMQPPFLGQGMCQGIRDAVNLCWKLIAVHQGSVRGRAAEFLLDSYGQERQAHVRELTSRLKHIGSIICERDAARASARDQRLLAECGGVVKDTPRQDVLPRLETGLLADVDTPGRGTLFPQPRLHDGLLMDQRYGYGWRVVVAGDMPAPASAPGCAIVPLTDSEHAEQDGVVRYWMQRHACQAAIVRPDHYVFGTASTAAELQALLAERQTTLTA